MAQSKPCPACNHPERATIDRALGIGQAPRSILRRYAGLNRKALQRHRDKCLRSKGERVLANE
jgi:hypothetical protein